MRLEKARWRDVTHMQRTLLTDTWANACMCTRMKMCGCAQEKNVREEKREEKEEEERRERGRQDRRRKEQQVSVCTLTVVHTVVAPTCERNQKKTLHVEKTLSKRKKSTFITPWPSWQKFFNSSSGFGTLINSQTSSFRVHLDLSYWYLVPSVGFSSIIVRGGFSVSRGIRLWDTDLPHLLIFDDAFVWPLSNCVRSNKATSASWGSPRHIICGFLSASSIHAKNAVHHWIHTSVVGTLLTATADQHVPCLPKKPKKDRENVPSSISVINTMANWWLCWISSATNSCIVFSIVRIIELLGRDQESTYLYIFLLIFLMNSLAMK